MPTVAEALAQAKVYHRAGQPQAAEPIYRQVLQVDPANAEACYLFGALCQALGKSSEAVAHLQRAVALQPQNAEAFNHLGVALGHQHQLDEAIACFQQAARLRPDLADAHNNLGIALRGQGKPNEAVACFRRLVELRPDSAEAHHSLGNALADTARPEEAAACFCRALERKPDFVEARYSLGRALRELGRFDEAAACFRRVLELRPDFADAHHCLGNVLGDTGKLEEAVSCFRRALELQPDLADANDNLGKAFWMLGRLDEAEACYRQTLAAKPGRPLYELRIAVLCPTVFQSNQQIDHYRQRLLADLQRFTKLDAPLDLAEAARLECQPSFNLPFHGRNDRPLKEAYAAVFRNAVRGPRPAPRIDLPRVGFVVTRGHESLFLRSMRGVIERLNPALFECVIVCAKPSYGTIRANIKNPAVGIMAVAGGVNEIADTIRAAQFDVLYFWEIATDATNYFLPFFRLAPVQCTSWGIQVTSGVPQVDYYLSSKLVEPDDARDHYSENLLLADTLLTFQERAAAPQPGKRRADFGLRPEQHLYVCAQQLGKFHPDFDPLLADILRRDAQGVIVVTEDRYGYNAARLRQRLATTIPDVAPRVVFVKFQPTADYLSLLAAADVLLDPLHFGGVNSTYDGLSLDQPIVTLPSQFQRGRYTLGCYKKMGISRCIASTAEQYVELALALANDADLRADVVAEIRETSPRLFEDLDAVREHERILTALVEKARSPS